MEHQGHLSKLCIRGISALYTPKSSRSCSNTQCYVATISFYIVIPTRTQTLNIQGKRQVEKARPKHHYHALTGGDTISDRPPGPLGSA